MGPRLRVRCTVRGLGPGRPPRRLKRVLLKLIEKLLKKKPRRSGPLRHSLVLIVEKKRRSQTQPPGPPGQSRPPFVWNEINKSSPVASKGEEKSAYQALSGLP